MKSTMRQNLAPELKIEVLRPSDRSDLSETSSNTSQSHSFSQTLSNPSYPVRNGPVFHRSNAADVGLFEKEIMLNLKVSKEVLKEQFNRELLSPNMEASQMHHLLPDCSPKSQGLSPTSSSNNLKTPDILRKDKKRKSVRAMQERDRLALEALHGQLMLNPNNEAFLPITKNGTNSKNQMLLNIIVFAMDKDKDPAMERSLSMFEH